MSRRVEVLTNIRPMWRAVRGRVDTALNILVLAAIVGGLFAILILGGGR